jgi:hypothetical protein
MKLLTSERMIRLIKQRGLQRFLGLCVIALLFMILGVEFSGRSLNLRIYGLRRQSQSELSSKQLPQLTTKASQAQSQQPAGGANTCRCLPPIPSEASATGVCTRTQDDGSFCALAFSLAQQAAAVSQSPTFDKYAMDSKLSIPKDRIRPDVGLLARNDIFILQSKDVAASIQAVAALAAFQRLNDSRAQSHFRDIFEMLTFQESVLIGCLRIGCVR